MDDARAASSIRRRWLTVGIQVTAGVIATAALVLCVRTLATGWDSIRASLRHADLGAVAAALVCAVTAMLFMAVLWQQCLRTFGARYPLRRVMTWFFAGELGKYLPGGIWPVVGRAEFGRRQGLDRSVGYGTTMLSLGLMCIGGAATCLLFSPFTAYSSQLRSVQVVIIAMVPVGIAMVHPTVLRPLLRLAARLTNGRFKLAAPAWGRMLVLIAVAIPTWIFVGGCSVLVTASLGYQQQVGQVAFAAVAAWIIGFLALPVPAGAGVREVLFILLSGLDATPATAVAAIARLMFVAIDGVAGAVALTRVRKVSDPQVSERNVTVAE